MRHTTQTARAAPGRARPRRRLRPARRLSTDAEPGTAHPGLRARDLALLPPHRQRARPASVRPGAGQRHRRRLDPRAEGDLYPISWRAPSRRRRRAVRQGPRDLRRLRVSPRPLCRELRLPVDAGAGQPGGLQLADPLSDPRRRPRYPPVQDGPELRGLSRTRRRLRRVDGHRDRQHASRPGTRHHAAARSRAPGDSAARRPDRRQSRDQPLLGADQALSVVVRRRRPPDAGGEVSPRNPGPDRAGVSPDAGLHAERLPAALPHHGRLRRSP